MHVTRPSLLYMMKVESWKFWFLHSQRLITATSLIPRLHPTFCCSLIPRLDPSLVTYCTSCCGRGLIAGGVEFGHAATYTTTNFLSVAQFSNQDSSFSPSMQERGRQSVRRVELDEPTAAVIIQRAWRSFNVTSISILFVLKGSEQPYFR